MSYVIVPRMDNISWAAGLLEGEGYFGLRRGGKDLVIQITMTDKDVIDRLHSVFAAGSIKERVLPSGKIAYTLTVANQTHAIEVMTAVLPFMGERRSAKIRHCLAEHAKVPAPKAQWTHCKNGHELTGNNLKVISEGKYTKRRCVECGKLRQRKHRAVQQNNLMGL